MASIHHTTTDHVAVLTLNSGENRFNPKFITTFIEKLDEIEQTTDTTTLVVTSAHEKIFSNGIDLEWLMPHHEKGDLTVFASFFQRLNELFKRLLTYPLTTIAAINGHAFAGGAILACAFDFRFMRTDRGYFCLPEVDLNIPFLPGMNAILAKAIPRYELEMLQYTGIRLTAEQCRAHHIVTEACHLDELMPEAMAFARQQNKKRAVMGELKRRLNADILRTIDTEDPRFFKSGAFTFT